MLFENSAQPYLIPGFDRPEKLNFAFLNELNHPRGQEILDRLIERGFRPRLMIDEDSPVAERGRRDQLRDFYGLDDYRAYPDSSAICQQYGIERAIVASHNGNDVDALLRRGQYDLVILGHTGLLKPNLLDATKYGILNIHPGLLPAIRGSNTYVWAVIHNLPQGASVHLIDAGVDRGPILHTKPMEPRPDLTYGRLIFEINRLCAAALLEALDKVMRGTAYLQPQAPDDRFTFRRAPPKIKAIAAEMLEERLSRTSSTTGPI
jgi:methionyl-tRNA formyltransferase